MIGYRLLPPAEEEMTEAALFYNDANSGLGEDFLDDIHHAINAVRDRPEIGAKMGYGFRRVLVRRFPFSVVYLVDRGEIVVVAIAHQKRSPGYWQNRV